MIRKTSLSSDRSDGVRSSSRHKAPARDVLVRDCSSRRLVTFQCSEIACRFTTLPSRSTLGAILPLHDVRYHAPASASRLDDGRGIVFDGRAVQDGFASRRRLRRFAFATFDPVTDARNPAGGARRDRTDDLLLAKQALSQLSYGPFQGSAIRSQ